MQIGARFAKWGLGLFIFGVLLTFSIVAHYCVGARWPAGELFMQNITLGWACLWTLSVAAIQAGGLGMVGLGLTSMVANRSGSADEAKGSGAFWLCVIGLTGVFAVGYPGNFVFDAIWPGYYYSPVAIGENAWMLGQALFIAIFFAGAVLMFAMVWRALSTVAEAA
ncbi:hypothetical protein [Kaistia sp. UC242_56]|uniref:hypothetical protein n=1 Tax=Kaistia sp. UC242_56 TaxID=3374625 RepID=UPI0037B9EA96